MTRQNTVNKCKDAKKVPHGKEGTLNQYINKYQRIEAEFNSFMYQAIRKCARNATRKVTAAEINNGIPLESLDEKYMVAIGYILECYCPQIESVLRKMAPWLSEQRRYPL